MDTEETRQSLAQTVTALERHLAEQNTLRAETNRLHEQRLALERKRLELAEETNQLYLRSVAQQENNGQNYKQRLVEQRVQQRWALIMLVVMVVAAAALLALLPMAHHPR